MADLGGCLSKAAEPVRQLAAENALLTSRAGSLLKASARRAKGVREQVREELARVSQAVASRRYEVTAGRPGRGPSRDRLDVLRRQAGVVHVRHNLAVPNGQQQGLSRCTRRHGREGRPGARREIRSLSQNGYGVCLCLSLSLLGP